MYQKLDTLKEGLQRETADFEEQKELELSELLLMQQKFAGEFEKSQVQISCSQSLCNWFKKNTILFIQSVVQSSAKNIKQVVADLEENADFVTALALFKFKSVDKQICFVAGLALVFKVTN